MSSAETVMCEFMSLQGEAASERTWRGAEAWRGSAGRGCRESGLIPAPEDGAVEQGWLTLSNRADLSSTGPCVSL